MQTEDQGLNMDGLTARQREERNHQAWMNRNVISERPNQKQENSLAVQQLSLQGTTVEEIQRNMKVAQKLGLSTTDHDFKYHAKSYFSAILEFILWFIILSLGWWILCVGGNR